MKFLVILLSSAFISGCSFDNKLSSATNAKEVTLQKLSIRQIDSLAAEMNYTFSIHNQVAGKDGVLKSGNSQNSPDKL